MQRMKTFSDEGNLEEVNKIADKVEEAIENGEASTNEYKFVKSEDGVVVTELGDNEQTQINVTETQDGGTDFQMEPVTEEDKDFADDTTLEVRTRENGKFGIWNNPTNGWLDEGEFETSDLALAHLTDLKRKSFSEGEVKCPKCGTENPTKNDDGTFTCSNPECNNVWTPTEEGTTEFSEKGEVFDTILAAIKTSCETQGISCTDDQLGAIADAVVAVVGQKSFSDDEEVISSKLDEILSILKKGAPAPSTESTEEVKTESKKFSEDDFNAFIQESTDLKEAANEAAQSADQDKLKEIIEKSNELELKCDKYMSDVEDKDSGEEKVTELKQALNEVKDLCTEKLTELNPEGSGGTENDESISHNPEEEDEVQKEFSSKIENGGNVSIFDQAYKTILRVEEK